MQLTFCLETWLFHWLGLQFSKRSWNLLWAVFKLLFPIILWGFWGPVKGKFAMKTKRWLMFLWKCRNIKKVLLLSTDSFLRGGQSISVFLFFLCSARKTRRGVIVDVQSSEASFMALLFKWPSLVLCSSYALNSMLISSQTKIQWAMSVR